MKKIILLAASLAIAGTAIIDNTLSAINVAARNRRIAAAREKAAQEQKRQQKGKQPQGTQSTPSPEQASVPTPVPGAQPTPAPGYVTPVPIATPVPIQTTSIHPSEGETYDSTDVVAKGNPAPETKSDLVLAYIAAHESPNPHDGSLFNIYHTAIERQCTEKIIAKNGYTIHIRQAPGLNQLTDASCGYYALHHAKALSQLENSALPLHLLQPMLDSVRMYDRQFFTDQLRRFFLESEVQHLALGGYNALENPLMETLSAIATSENISADYGHIGIHLKETIGEFIAGIIKGESPQGLVAVIQIGGHYVAVRLEQSEHDIYVTVINSTPGNLTERIEQWINAALAE